MTDATKHSIFRWIHIVFGILSSVVFIVPSNKFQTTPPLFGFFPLV
jgi:hypothetical protein